MPGLRPKNASVIDVMSLFGHSDVTSIVFIKISINLYSYIVPLQQNLTSGQRTRDLFYRLVKYVTDDIHKVSRVVFFPANRARYKKSFREVSHGLRWLQRNGVSLSGTRQN